MLELRLPLDYEQLPAVWQLRDALAQKRSRENTPPKQIEQSASFIFHRLFVTLGYLAQSTNKPGLLTEAGARQFRSSLEPLFGDDCDPVALLQSIPDQFLRPVDGGGWQCDLFARLNAHLAGNYRPGHIKGNVNSRVSAAHKRFAEEAPMQAMLLSPEIFKTREGVVMSSTETHRSLVLVRNLDRCLRLANRDNSGFTAGLMASAHAVIEKHDDERLREFYFWLVNNYEHPSIPKTTEELLEKFENYFPLAK